MFWDRKEEFIGKPVYDLKILPEKYIEKGIFRITRALRGEILESDEYLFIAKDGRTVFAEVSGAPIRGITVESQSGHGRVFRVFLPISAEPFYNSLVKRDNALEH